jgi:hypothetical protein
MNARVNGTDKGKITVVSEPARDFPLDPEIEH